MSRNSASVNVMDFLGGIEISRRPPSKSPEGTAELIVRRTN